MAAYWLAPSLERFRAELNAAYPNRDKTSDGWIGDKKHAASDSDHNPEGWRQKPKTWAGVVRAFDADNDLSVGRNAQALVDYLASRLGKHPALMGGAYLIYNGRIISTDRLAEGWRKYSGKNPHKGHVHVSVGRSPSSYNSTAPWGIHGAPAPISNSPESEEDDDMAKTSAFYYQRASDKSHVYLLVNAGSGFVHEYESGGPTPVDGGYNSGIARGFDTGNYEPITESHAAAIKRDALAMRSSSVDLSGSVKVDAADAPKGGK